MPRAAHRVADQQSFGQRTVIVAARRTDGEQLGALARQQHLLVADMAHKHAAVGKVGEGNTLAQIGPAGLGVLLSHCILPRRSWVIGVEREDAPWET